MGSGLVHICDIASHEPENDARQCSKLGKHVTVETSFLSEFIQNFCYISPPTFMKDILYIFRLLK